MQMPSFLHGKDEPQESCEGEQRAIQKTEDPYITDAREPGEQKGEDSEHGNRQMSLKSVDGKHLIPLVRVNTVPILRVPFYYTEVNVPVVGESVRRSLVGVPPRSA